MATELFSSASQGPPGRWKTDVLQQQTCGEMSFSPKAGPAGGTTWEQRKIDIDHLHVTITSFVVVCRLSFWSI